MQVTHQDEGGAVRQNWSKFLSSQALWLGAILLASGLVCLLAANWAALGKWTRLGGLEVLLIATVGASAWAGLRRGRHSTLFLALVMLAAIGVGALLALVGQTYQTGAQGWQLFAWWTLLLLPWAWAARRPGMWIFWVVIFNIASLLWLDVGGQVLASLLFETSSGAWQLAVPNLIGLALWTFAGERIGATGKAGLRLLAVLAVWPLAFEATTGILAAPWLDHGYASLGIVVLAWLALSLALVQRYGRTGGADLWVLAAVAIGAIAVSLAFIGNLLRGIDDAFLLALLSIIVAGEAAVVAWWLLRVHERESGPRPAGEAGVPLSVQIVLAFGAWLIALFGIGLLLLLSVVVSEESALVSGVVMMVLAVVLLQPSRLREGASRGAHLAQQLGVACALGGMVLAGVGMGMLMDMPYPALLLGLAAAALYVAAPNRVLRFVTGLVQAAALVIVLQWLLLYTLLAEGTYWYIHLERILEGDPAFWLGVSPELLLLPLMAIVAFWRAHGPAQRTVWAPAALAWACVAQAVAMNSAGMDPATLGSLFSHASWQVVVVLAYVLLPVAVSAWVLRQVPQPPALAWRIGLPLAMLVVAVVCLSAPEITLALVWVWMGIGLQRRWLRVFGTVLLLVGLLHYYYSLDVSLLHKSVSLLLAGLFALAVAGLLRRGRQAREAEVVTAGAGLTRAALAALAGGLVCVLVVANAGVWRYETILKHGKPLLLELAPVDPRALLQGDYMDLSYGVDRDLFDLAYDSEAPVEASGYAVLDAGIGQPARLLRLQPEALPQAEDEVVVPIRAGSWGRQELALTGAYFFAEGLEPYFAPARYGEFRVDEQGKAVLLQLRDEMLLPMIPGVERPAVGEGGDVRFPDSPAGSSGSSVLRRSPSGTIQAGRSAEAAAAAADAAAEAAEAAEAAAAAAQAANDALQAR